MNGGGGLSSIELSAGTSVLDDRRSVTPAGSRTAGDVLTLLPAGPASVTRLERDEPTPGTSSGATWSTSPKPDEVTLRPTGEAWQATAERLERLAQQFAQLDAEQAHDLFASAFGLYGARHFGIAPEPSGAELAEVSWWHGPTVRQPLDPILASVLPRARRARRRSGGATADTAGDAAGGGAGQDRANGGRHRKPPLPAGTEELGADERQEMARAVERRAAARMLLAHPLVTATGPYAEAFELIQRHAAWLAEKFDELLGYPLVVTGSFARLRKAGIGAGALRRLEIDGTPCTPEGYLALALALSVLLTGPGRWPAGQLAAELTAAVDDAGVEFAAGRRAVTAALSVLAQWQVLADPGSEGWLTVDQELAAALGAGLRDTEVRTAAELGDTRRGGDPLGAADVTVPVAVRRRLAETPVVLLDDLTALEREWLWESRQREAETFAGFLGLTAELRSEGMALLDPAGELTDLRLPGGDGAAHAALLLVERLVEQLRPLPQESEGDAAPAGPVLSVPIPEALIDGTLGDVADEYGAAADWCRVQLADRAAFRRDVLSLLHRMRLIAPASRLASAHPTATDGRPGAMDDAGSRARAAGGWVLLAPAARYAIQAELRPAPGKGRHSRRGEHH